ncbi:MAG: hypothetical protein WAW03_15340, partial [Anaerolineae bacterium]
MKSTPACSISCFHHAAEPVSRRWRLLAWFLFLLWPLLACGRFEPRPTPTPAPPTATATPQ